MHRLTLSPSERRLWNAYTTASVTPVTAKVIRAEVIAALLLGARKARPGTVPSVRLRGARITGRLDVSGGMINCILLLQECVFDEMPDFSNARTHQVRIAACRLPGFDGGGLRTDGYLSLSRSVITGEVRLQRAQLTGGFRMNDTKIINPDGFALFSGGLTVDAGAFIRRAEIDGTLRLTGARMSGGLFLEGTTLCRPGGEALSADNIVVEDAMECGRGFTAEGAVRLRGARVHGTLSFDRAVLRAPGARVLHLSHAKIDELILTPVAVEGEATLAHSRIAVLLDHPSAWPRELRLNGLTYESVRGSDDADQRIDWLGRDPAGFRSQPYEQFAAYLRRIGMDARARKILLARQRARRKRKHPLNRVWGLMLDWTVGYGYRPWITGVWLAILIAVGTTVFEFNPPLPLRAPEELPEFYSLIYTLDLLIPIETFGLRSTYDPVAWTRWLAHGLTATGWILATVLIAGITRVLRRP